MEVIVDPPSKNESSPATLLVRARGPETGLEEINGDLREADFGEICDAAGVARHGRGQFVRNTNISSTGLIDSPYDASWVLA